MVTALEGRFMILVVDDDEDTRSVMRDVLEDHGYAVLEAGDGQEALETLSNNASMVGDVILDLRMPRMSGWDLLEILRSNTKLSRIPVLVTTAVSVHGDASGIGATMLWLRKPFGSEELVSAIERCAVGER